MKKVILICGLMFFMGCMPPASNIKIASVLYEPEGAQNNSWEAPGLFRITFNPLNATSDSIGFVIQSLCDKTLKIYWDDSAYIDQSNNSHRIFHGGMRVIERDKAQPPSVLAARTQINDIIAPTDFAYFRPSMGAYDPGGWQQRPLFYLVNERGWALFYLATDLNGKSVALLLVIGDDVEKKPYTFRFRLNQSEAPAPPKPTPRKSLREGTEERRNFTGH